MTGLVFVAQSVGTLLCSVLASVVAVLLIAPGKKAT